MKNGQETTAFLTNGPDLSWCETSEQAAQMNMARHAWYTRSEASPQPSLLDRMREACLILADLRQEYPEVHSGGGNLDGALSACMLVVAYLTAENRLSGMVEKIGDKI